MLRKVAQKHGLDESLLPSHVIDAPADSKSGSSYLTAPLTDLLKGCGAKIRPDEFNLVLEAAGLLEKLTRRTNQKKRHPTGEKTFWHVTRAGERFGKNVHDHSPRETAPHWYVDRFSTLRKFVQPTYRKLRTEGIL